MARELTRSFDHALGAVVVQIEQWDGGPVEAHTLYVTGPEELHVEQRVAELIEAAGARAARVLDAFRRAGWQG